MPISPRHLTRILATLGPATDADGVCESLVAAGATTFRLNFSHGDLETHEKRLAQVRRVATESGVTLGVLGDLPGPKMRVGRVDGEGVVVTRDELISFVRGEVLGSRDHAGNVVLGSTYAQLLDDVTVGQPVLVDDGAVRMTAIESTPDRLRCRVVQGGRISSGKGINLPEAIISAPTISERDRRCVAWAIEHELDYLAMSFVRSATDLLELAELVRGSSGAGSARIPLVAKIERPEAIVHLDAIVDTADILMIARGDLGVETDFAQVPVLQKRIIDAARGAGKPTIVATQMLQSMIEQPTPTRAEASDVAHAIFDSVDAVMLSGETAVGRWPVESVESMARIAVHAEQYVASSMARDVAPRKLIETGHPTAALAHGVWYIARDNRAAMLVVWSESGGGARYLSQNEFAIPIVALSTNGRAVRQMTLLRGVTPVLMEAPPTLAALTERVDALLLERNWATRGDRVVLIAGYPLGTPRATNAVAMHEVGNGKTGFR